MVFLVIDVEYFIFTFFGQLCRRTQVIDVEIWYEYSKNIGLMKKVGFEMFNKVGIFFY
jgi:hypothetical protein